MFNHKYPTQVNQAMVRTNALLTMAITGVALVTGLWSVMALLAADFFVRGFLNPRMSVLSSISSNLIPFLPFRSRSIYFPPKQFAARVGMGFALTSALLLSVSESIAAAIVMMTLIVFAAMECLFNVCMGCILYNAFLTVRRKLG
jgi:predicted Co/Zn/Cd cation transporter (cation efflux family)